MLFSRITDGLMVPTMQGIVDIVWYRDDIKSPKGATCHAHVTSHCRMLARTASSLAELLAPMVPTMQGIVDIVGDDIKHPKGATSRAHVTSHFRMPSELLCSLAEIT